jgi:hypothetical protein
MRKYQRSCLAFLILLGASLVAIPVALAGGQGSCYKHHSCPNDGFIGKSSKRQCSKNPQGYSWRADKVKGNSKNEGCENLK